MDTVTINITETPNDVTINVTVGGGGMQCADLAACQTIIDIVADINTVSSDLNAHETNTSNPHNVTKSQVGLSNVDNTSDINKPVSTAQQTALNLKIQSVTGSQVDNTDPVNPVVNPLGLIKIIDLNGDFFTDLATATIYIEQFFSDPTIITDKSFNDNIFFFTVPNSTVMDLADGFLKNTNSASFIDSFGLIKEFQGVSVFYQNNAKHIFKDIFFNVTEAFTDSELDCECNDFNMDAGTAFASNTNGTFKINGNIGAACASSGFFSASTATILASAKLYTSNAGVIDASLEQAISHGCNVQFDGINLEEVSNKSTSVVTDQASNTKYPSVKSVFDWVTALFATKGSIQKYYSGKRVTIPFAGTSSAITGWNGAVIYIPIPITSSVAFTDISQEVTALAVGANIRLALYTSVNGLPASLLEDSGNISTSTTGIKNYVLSATRSFTAVDKQVFVAIQSSNAAVGLRYALNTVCFNYFNGSGVSGTLFRELQVFGAFPATATPSVYPNANSPLVSLLVQ